MRKRWMVPLIVVLTAAACALPAATPTAPATTAAQTVSTTIPTQAAVATSAAPTGVAGGTATGAPATSTQPAGAATTPPTAAASATPGQPGGIINPAAYRFAQVAQGFQAPLLVTAAGDGSGRLFVVEQGGLIRIVQNGAVLPQPYIDLSGLVTHGGSEQGLLGLAFDPHYAQSGQFYVDYTDVNGTIHLARYHVSASDPNQADAGSGQVLLGVPKAFLNHNGGNIVFGPDGYLYVSIGDGGSEGDPNLTGQDRTTLFAKLLRLDVSGGGDQYNIPPSNPFVGQSGVRPEIWAYGLRNPWRVSFDRATGDLWIGDVGQDTYEEIDYQPAGDVGGEDYGWSLMEGLHPYKGQPPAGLTLTPPIAEYTHQEGGCAVTGGYVYRGPSLPELNGVYIFGDFCSGLTWTLTRAGDQWQRAPFIRTGFTISSFGSDEAGELYVCDYRGGAIYRLTRAQ